MNLNNLLTCQGGSIGAGLFVGTGSALRTGGPASLLIDYAIIGVMIFNVVFALGELAIMYPVSGGFYTYSTRFIDPSWGFAMGWVSFLTLIWLPSLIKPELRFPMGYRLASRNHSGFFYDKLLDYGCQCRGMDLYVPGRSDTHQYLRRLGIW